MKKEPIPLPVVISRLQAELLVIMNEVRDLPNRGFDTGKRRAERIAEWDHKYDQMMQLRLHAYEQGIVLPPLFPVD